MSKIPLIILLIYGHHKSIKYRIFYTFHLIMNLIMSFLNQTLHILLDLLLSLLTLLYLYVPEKALFVLRMQLGVLRLLLIPPRSPVSSHQIRVIWRIDAFIYLTFTLLLYRSLRSAHLFLLLIVRLRLRSRNISIKEDFLWLYEAGRRRQREERFGFLLVRSSRLHNAVSENIRIIQVVNVFVREFRWLFPIGTFSIPQSIGIVQAPPFGSPLLLLPTPPLPPLPLLLLPLPLTKLFQFLYFWMDFLYFWIRVIT